MPNVYQITLDFNSILAGFRPWLTGEIQKGTGGRGRDRKCHKLSQIVVTFYDEFYDVL